MFKGKVVGEKDKFCMHSMASSSIGLEDDAVSPKPQPNDKEANINDHVSIDTYSVAFNKQRRQRNFSMNIMEVEEIYVRREDCCIQPWASNQGWKPMEFGLSQQSIIDK